MRSRHSSSENNRAELCESDRPRRNRAASAFGTSTLVHEHQFDRGPQPDVQQVNALADLSRAVFRNRFRVAETLVPDVFGLRQQRRRRKRHRQVVRLSDLNRVFGR